LPDDVPVLECFHCKAKEDANYRFFKGRTFCEACTTSILDKLKSRHESQSSKAFILTNVCWA
jgi:hypothetical protein